jgi:hypothetical protein
MPGCVTVHDILYGPRGVPPVDVLPFANTVINSAATSAQTSPAALATGVVRPAVRPGLRRTFTGPYGGWNPQARAPAGYSVQGGGMGNLGEVQLGSLGTLFCADLDAAKANLAAALASAQAQGIAASDPRYIAGAAFLQQETDWSTKTAIVIPFIGDDCQRLTAECLKNVTAVGQAISDAGGTAPALPRPNFVPGSGLNVSSVFDTLKTLAIPAAVVVGFIALAPVIGELVAARRLARGSRGLAGYRKRRSKRKGR